jgi:hypothetical protein
MKGAPAKTVVPGSGKRSSQVGQKSSADETKQTENEATTSNDASKAKSDATMLRTRLKSIVLQEKTWKAKVDNKKIECLTVKVRDMDLPVMPSNIRDMVADYENRNSKTKEGSIEYEEQLIHHFKHRPTVLKSSLSTTETRNEEKQEKSKSIAQQRYLKSIFYGIEDGDDNFPVKNDGSILDAYKIPSETLNSIQAKGGGAKIDPKFVTHEYGTSRMVGLLHLRWIFLFFVSDFVSFRF